MEQLTLGFISAFNERVEPLMNGTIEVEGVELIPTYSHPAETFWRQLKFGEFEVAEMSMSSFLIARSQGADMIALPAFPSRRLFQTELSYHVDSGIAKPQDLVGKRLGVAEYQQTAASVVARHSRTRLRRVAVPDSLVHGAERGDEPRWRHRFQTAAGNIF